MQNKFGDTALIIASSKGHFECATILLKHKADVNYQRKVRLFSVVCRMTKNNNTCSVA